MAEVIKDEMLKKYEENVYLISQIFDSEPIESDDESLSCESDAESENHILNEDTIATFANSVPEKLYGQLKQIFEERKELEQEYQKIFADEQNLEKFQDEELDRFENSNKDFHQLFHELKQAKLKVPDVEGYIKRAKEIEVFPDTHPAILNIEGRSAQKIQRPFADNEHIDYLIL